jgi:hypothetical protein
MGMETDEGTVMVSPARNGRWAMTADQEVKLLYGLPVIEDRRLGLGVPGRIELGMWMKARIFIDGELVSEFYYIGRSRKKGAPRGTGEKELHP